MRSAAAHAAEWIAERPARRSLEALQRTLSRTTEFLAGELGRPGTKAPEWCDPEWAVARAVAAIHGISPLLARTLRWQGTQSWREFLETQTLHTAGRFLRMQQLLQAIDARARPAAIPVVPLKGAALHALGIYAPGERPMADIDLLIRPEDARPFAAVLAALGFTETDRTWKNAAFTRHDDHGAVALGEHVDNGIKIELHCRIAEALPRRLVDVTAGVLPEFPVPGLNAYPSRAALMLHLLLHASGSLISRGVRLVQLHDIARLSALMDAADWLEVAQRGEHASRQSLWWAYPPLALVNRYYGGVPAPMLRRAAADCHWALRRVYRDRTLAQASLSHLWISAIPGIEWARSPLGMIGYAATRVIPGRALLRRHRLLAQSQPRIYSGSWWQLSHVERIVRWLLAPQARHETLQPVRAALVRENVGAPPTT